MLRASKCWNPTVRQVFGRGDSRGNQTSKKTSAEYKLTHFDDIVTKKANAAVQAALAKSSAADKHSSKPNSANGKPDSGKPDKISTVAGLNSILKDM
jgi:hypothetical protein